MCDDVRKTVESYEMGDSTSAALEPIEEIVNACHKDFEKFRKLAFTIENMKNDITSFEKIKKLIHWNDENQYFLEGVVKRLNLLGVNCTISDRDIILNEVRTRFKNKIGIPLYKENKAIELWFEIVVDFRTAWFGHLLLFFALFFKDFRLIILYLHLDTI